MKIGISKLLGFDKAVVEPINAVGKILDEAFTSKDETLTHEEIRLRILQKPLLLQSEINKVSQTHRSLFVAGWRPFIGWVCGWSLAFFYIPQFALASYLWLKMCLEANKLLPYPEVNSDRLFELILGMMGLALMRTVEKKIGKTL